MENSDISHICPGNHNSVKLNLSELYCQADATILRNSEWRLSTAEVGKGLKKEVFDQHTETQYYLLGTVKETKNALMARRSSS